MFKLIGIVLIIFGITFLILITWLFHIRKHKLLQKRLERSDETLLTEPGLKIDSIFQAPEGSMIHPYIIINDDTVKNN